MTQKDRRLDLHNKFIEILGTQNERESRVYYQPPESVRMKYPAIAYKKDGGRIIHADNRSYLGKQRYLVTVIDANPDSEIASSILSAFRLVRIARNFTVDNLNHDVLELYY